jgi:hypothetical protein
VRRCWQLPIRNSVPLICRDRQYDALPPVVHAKRPAGPTAIHLLQAKLARGEFRPGVQIRRANPDITERRDRHAMTPFELDYGFMTCSGIL